MLSASDFAWLDSQPEDQVRRLAETLDNSTLFDGIQGERVLAGLTSGPARRRVEPEPRTGPGGIWIIHRGSGAELQIVVRADRAGLWVGLGLDPRGLDAAALARLDRFRRAWLQLLEQPEDGLLPAPDAAPEAGPVLKLAAAGRECRDGLGRLSEPLRQALAGTLAGPLFYGLLVLPAENAGAGPDLAPPIARGLAAVRPLYSRLLAEFARRW